MLKRGDIKDTARKSAATESLRGTDMAMRGASDETKLGSDKKAMAAKQESLLRKERRKMTEGSQADTRQVARETAPSFIAQILGQQANRAWKVRKPDGTEKLNCHNATRTKWKRGNWVTVEEVAGEYSIVGGSPSGSGPAPEEEP